MNAETQAAKNVLNDMCDLRRELPPDIKMTPKELTDLLQIVELRRIATILENISRALGPYRGTPGGDWR